MANVNQAKGLSPVGTVTGAAYNEQGRLYAVANDASNTYAIGDVVKMSTSADANGVPYCTKAASTDVPLGVIVGIRVADDGVSLVGNSLSLEKAYLPKSSGVRYVYVVDDPNIVMEIQSDSTGQAQDDVGKNCGMTITADQTSTLGNSSPYSSTVIDHANVKAIGTSGSLAYPLQILGISSKPDNQVGATSSTASPYMKMLVVWNKHQYKQAQGTA